MKMNGKGKVKLEYRVGGDVGGPRLAFETLGDAVTVAAVAVLPAAGGYNSALQLPFNLPLLFRKEVKASRLGLDGCAHPSTRPSRAGSCGRAYRGDDVDLDGSSRRPCRGVSYAFQPLPVTPNPPTPPRPPSSHPRATSARSATMRQDDRAYLSAVGVERRCSQTTPQTSTNQLLRVTEKSAHGYLPHLPHRGVAGGPTALMGRSPPPTSPRRRCRLEGSPKLPATTKRRRLATPELRRWRSPPHSPPHPSHPSPPRRCT